MVSVRVALLDALVARLATITGWTARLDNGENREGNAPIVANVFMVDEDKQLANSDHYLATLQVGVQVCARRDRADATLDGGNPWKYLDRLVVLLEKKVHAPDSWGVNPDYTEVVINGHTPYAIDGDETTVYADVLITFTYRHSYLNPEAL
jgi:hypothetical protein